MHRVGSSFTQNIGAVIFSVTEDRKIVPESPVKAPIDHYAAFRPGVRYFHVPGWNYEGRNPRVLAQDKNVVLIQAPGYEFYVLDAADRWRILWHAEGRTKAVRESAVVAFDSAVANR